MSRAQHLSGGRAQFLHWLGNPPLRLSTRTINAGKPTIAGRHHAWQHPIMVGAFLNRGPTLHGTQKKNMDQLAMSKVVRNHGLILRWIGMDEVRPGCFYQRHTRQPPQRFVGGRKASLAGAPAPPLSRCPALPRLLRGPPAKYIGIDSYMMQENQRLHCDAAQVFLTSNQRRDHTTDFGSHLPTPHRP